MGSRARIPTLDGWRAVAITAVMVSHGFLLSDATTRPLRAIGYVAVHLGGVGVALFFAISGYLITTLLLEERERSLRISLGGFYLRRAFRILPAAFLYLGVLALASTSGWLAESVHRGELASAAFFYNNYWADRSWYTMHFWSLSTEEHFYLIWPALLASLGVRRALLIAGVLAVAIALWRPWSLAHMQLPFPALQRTDLRLDAFLYAGAMAILLHGRHRAKVLRVLTATWFRVLGIVVPGALWIWIVAGSAPATGTLIESALLPCLLISVIDWPGSRLFRVLEWAPLRWIGRISYGLYLWQQLFLVPHSAATLAQAAAEFLPRIAIVFGAATASYYLMERPLLRYSHGLSHSVPATAARARPGLEPSSIMEP